MKLIAYMMTFMMLLGAGIMATEYGYTAQLAGIEAPTQQYGMLGYAVSYNESGKVMSSAFMNGQPRSFLHDSVDDLDTLPGPKALPSKPNVVHSSSSKVAQPKTNSDRTVIHSSKNVCTNSGSCRTVRSGSTTCGTVYYRYPQTYYTNPCYSTCRTYSYCRPTWQYQRCQPVRNCVRYFHNRQPVRSCIRRVFGRRCR